MHSGDNYTCLCKLYFYSKIKTAAYSFMIYGKVNLNQDQMNSILDSVDFEMFKIRGTQ